MKNFFFLILFAISFLNTHGQIDKKSSTKKYQAGLIAGANASHFSSRVGEFSVLTNTSYSDYVRIAPMVGFHNRFNFSKAFSLSAELIFKSRGGSYRTDQTGVTTIGGNGDKAYYYRNYRLNYLEIPVVAELDLMPDVDDDRLHVRLGGGFSYGFLLASSLRYNGFVPTGGTAGPLAYVNEEYYTTDFNYGKSTMLNYVFDLTFDFVNRKELPLYLKVRYSGTTASVYSVDQVNGYNYNTKMSTISLLFGFYFNEHSL